jgi:hypothetical protein
MCSCGELNDEKSIYSESPVFWRLQHNTFDLRMVSKRNVLVYIHLSVMLSVELASTQYFVDALLFTVSTLNLFFLRYWILRHIAIDKTIDMISFLFRTSTIISSFGEFVQIWNINYLESSFVVFCPIKIDTTDYRIVFGLLISEYLTFALIIQNATIRKWVHIEICLQKSWTVLSSIVSRNRIVLSSKWFILFDWAFSGKKQTHFNNFYAFESILNFSTRWFL